MKKRSLNQRADEILDSLDGLQKAGAPDFFYTRLTGRMQQSITPATRTFFLLKPAFLTAALSVVLLVNIIALQKINVQPKNTTTKNAAATIESFADAYNLNSTSAY